MLPTSEEPSGPPYLPNVAGVGGRPVVDIDIPILAVFLLIYLIGAVSSMTIFQLNRRKGHKFLISWAMFGFCMARIVTCIMRIVWTTRSSNASIAIAAQIFTSAGVLVLYIITLILSQRIFRATHPEKGWNMTLSRILKTMYALLGLAFALTIAFTILSFYTLNSSLRTAALWVQRGSILYMLGFNVISTALFLLSIFLPRSTAAENFGAGSMRAKLVILGVAIFFCDFIAGFRMGTTWAPARLPTNPAWYHSKAAFYVIELGFEIIVLYLFLITRIDKRFWIPNGSRAPGDYSRSMEFAEKDSASSLATDA